MGYVGRLAPTPTGWLHLGHARTFWIAFQRALLAGGRLIFRMEDLDPQRCRPEWVAGALEDLRWLGISWQEGPDVGGAAGPYVQSERRWHYERAWQRLRDEGVIYPCQRSRRELREWASGQKAAGVSEQRGASAAAIALAGDEQDAEPFYPLEWRPPLGTGRSATAPEGATWRFRVPEGRWVTFSDAVAGATRFQAGVDFGDFVVWRGDGVPAYELAVVVDDAAMGVTEVVRGADLLRSTARQLLLAEALGLESPAWCQLPLLRDASGQRLAKRTAGLAIRELRQAGWEPENVLRAAGLAKAAGGTWQIVGNELVAPGLSAVESMGR